ncbi:MAG: serine hydroxymethyltransferase [archaeon]
MNVKEIISEVKDTVKKHDQWRGRECINLIASENVMSPMAWQLYNSDFEHRYAEGMPHKRYYQGLSYVDEVETACIDLGKKLFGAQFLDVRPISGCLSILIVLTSFAKHGDHYVAPSVPAGAHISQAEFGAAGIRGLEVRHMPLDRDEMNLDIDKSRKVILEHKPKLVNAGGTIFLFPHPLKELREAADEVGAVLTYDSSHVLGLVAGKQFQDPLREGVDVVGASAHKTFPGPQGGIIFGNKEEHYKKIRPKIFPALVSNHHLHRLPALAVTMAEMLEFGESYAKQIIKNAQALAESLHGYGFDVLAENKGFTKSHQVIVDVSKYGGGAWTAETLEKANIILNKNLLPWEDVNNSANPAGIRIGTAEMTHFGMLESDMKHLAELMKRVVVDKEDPACVKEDVKAFRNDFLDVKYCFR